MASSRHRWASAPDGSAASTHTGAGGDVVLLHEMSHADHEAHGTQDDRERPRMGPDGKPLVDANGKPILQQLSRECFNGQIRKQKGLLLGCLVISEHTEGALT